MNGNTEIRQNRPKRKRGGLFVIAAFIIALVIISKREPVNTIDCDASTIASEPDVIMLGAWGCTYCYQAKRYFQMNSFHYCEYDMETTVDGRRLYLVSGGGAVPIMFIGDYQLSGFSEQQIEAALALLNK